MSGEVLFDYTTIIGAANALNCEDLVFPTSRRNPYAEFLAKEKSPADSPMWLEWAALAEIVEAAVIHDKLLLMRITDNDRVLERGRYNPQDQTRVPLLSRLKLAGVVHEIELDHHQTNTMHTWLKGAASDPIFLDRMLSSMFQLLKHPVYREMPDLFSHSQTVYKFDGETVWGILSKDISVRQFSKKYQVMKVRNGYEPVLKYAGAFYAEDILAFLVRGFLYNELAKTNSVAYHPHPLRSAVAMSDGLWAEGKISEFGDVPIEFIANLRKQIATDHNQALGKKLFEVDLPPILAAVLKESQRPEDIPEIIVQMRETSAAKALRKWLSEIEKGGGLEIINAHNELNSFSVALRRELGLQEETIGVSLWLFSYKLKIPKWAQTAIYLGSKRHLQFLKNIFVASLDVKSLESELLRIYSRSA